MLLNQFVLKVKFCLQLLQVHLKFCDVSSLRASNRAVDIFVHSVQKSNPQTLHGMQRFFGIIKMSVTHLTGYCFFLSLMVNSLMISVYIYPVLVGFFICMFFTLCVIFLAFYCLRIVRGLYFRILHSPIPFLYFICISVNVRVNRGSDFGPTYT